MRSTKLQFIQNFAKHSVSLVSVTAWLLIIYACASNLDIPPSSGLTPVECEDNDEYFIGIATGRHKDSTKAVLIAKTRALGELSDNIEVKIMSVLKLADSKFEENIISISSATIRRPEYSISVTVGRGTYIARVRVKKSKVDYLLESARDLNMPNTGEMILYLLKAQASEKHSP